MLTVVIPYRNAPKALLSLLKTIPAEWPVIVVTDDCRAPDGAAKRAKVVKLKDRGYFAGAVNAGIEACDTDVLVLNQDSSLLGDGGAAFLAEHRDQFAIIGDGVMAHPAWPDGYVQGTYMFMRRDALDAVGLLDAKRWPLWGCTAEWQLRAQRLGYLSLPLCEMAWYKHHRHGGTGSSISELLKEQPTKRGWFIRTPPLISVVATCHNYGRYLPDLLASLLGGESCIGTLPPQTFAGFEVVIVDDASTDGSAEIVRDLAEKHRSHGVRAVILEQNVGTAKALNAGIKASYGRYIQVIDGDDMLAPNALEALMDVIEAQGGYAYSDQYIANGGKLTDHWKMRDVDPVAILDQNAAPTGTMMYKHDWERVGGYPESLANGRQDWGMALNMLQHGIPARHVCEPLYYYRREGQNRSDHNTTPTHRREFREQMEKLFPKLYRKARWPKSTLEDGVMLEYVGYRHARYRIPAASMPSGRRYEFRGPRSIREVDRRDARELLDLYEADRRAFRVVELEG